MQGTRVPRNKLVRTKARSSSSKQYTCRLMDTHVLQITTMDFHLITRNVTEYESTGAWIRMRGVEVYLFETFYGHPNHHSTHHFPLKLGSLMPWWDIHVEDYRNIQVEFDF